jgi:hypothetical protein
MYFSKLTNNKFKIYKSKGNLIEQDLINLIINSNKINIKYRITRFKFSKHKDSSSKIK